MEKISALLDPNQMHWVRIPPYSEQTLAGITRQTLIDQLNIRLEDLPETDAILQNWCTRPAPGTRVRRCGWPARWPSRLIFRIYSAAEAENPVFFSEKEVR